MPKYTETNDENKFVIGKAIQLTDGADVTIVATGHMVWEALQASEKLEELGISAEVLNMHTIKPLDAEAVLTSVAKTGCVVTAEEHNYIGGLGESNFWRIGEKQACPSRICCCKR